MSQPYLFINDRFQGYANLREQFSSNDQERDKFNQMNRHILNQPTLAGEPVIVSRGSPSMCTREERELMYYAQDIHMTMLGMGLESTNIMVQNFDLLQSMMSYGSIGIGSSTGAWSKHLGAVGRTLKEVEELHKRWRVGGMTNDQFFAQRSVLFSRLDTQLKGVARFGSGLKNNGSIKKMLGISSKSFMHTGEIWNYAQHVKRVSSAAKVLSKGTYLGIALDVGAGALEIQEACSAGREEACTRAKYVEVGKGTLGVPLSLIGGWAGAGAAAALCVAIGLPSLGAGTLACAIVGGAAGAWSGGTTGNKLGEKAGRFLHETSR